MILFINIDESLERLTPIMKAIRLERIIVKRIIIRLENERVFRIS